MAPDARGDSGSRHPDGELLDAYADGERTPGSVDRHVRACADCQQAVVTLRAVRDELSRLAPVPMPPDVASRIHAALAAAPPPAAPRPDRDGPGGGRGRARDRRGPGRSRRPPSYGSPARSLVDAPGRPVLLPRGARPERLALLAVCLLIVIAGTSLFAVWGRGGNSSTAAETSNVAMSAADSAAGSAAGGDAARAPAAALPSAAGAIPVSDSHAVLGPEAVAQHAKDLLAGRIPAAGFTTLDASTPAQGAAAGTAAAWETIVTPGLLGCYGKLATSVGTVLAVDLVSYRGRDAVLVILDIQDVSDISGASGASTGQDGATPTVPAAVSPGEDRVQLSVVDLGCDASHLADDTRYTGTATKA